MLFFRRLHADNTIGDDPGIWGIDLDDMYDIKTVLIMNGRDGNNVGKFYLSCSFLTHPEIFTAILQQKIHFELTLNAFPHISSFPQSYTVITQN